MIGTARHESSRVDLQLRGRAGRQGDPGESRFFVSLEDELIVRFGLDALIPARSVPERSEQPIDDRIVTREVARVQRIIEGQNYEIRRTLARYAAVLEQQQAIVANKRRRLLMREEHPDIWQDDAAHRDALVAEAGEEVVADAERLVVLGCIDRAWRDHLALATDLRDGIHLVRLGGRDPLTQYTSEMIRAFSELDEVVDTLALAALTKVRVDGGRLDLSGDRLEGAVVDVDVPRQRRSVQESHRHARHRAGRRDRSDLWRGDDDAAVSGVGGHRGTVPAGAAAAGVSVWEVARFSTDGYSLQTVIHHRERRGRRGCWFLENLKGRR